jgi:hypothetical protein
VPGGWTTYEVNCKEIRWTHKNDSCCMVVHEHGPSKGTSCKWGRCVPGAPEPPDWEPDGPEDGDGDEDENVCGPDVSAELGKLWVKVLLHFPGHYQGTDLCDLVFPLSFNHLVRLLKMVARGGFRRMRGYLEAIWDMVTLFANSFTAWDITELHLYDQYIGSQYPSCAAGDDCQKTVWVGNGCFKAWAVNYSLYGLVGRLCNVPLGEVHGRISLWKTYAAILTLGTVYRLEDVEPAQNWASMGYSLSSPWPGDQMKSQGYAYVPCPKCATPFQDYLTAHVGAWTVGTGTPLHEP